MPDYQLLIFDWDGTLVDSIGRIVESMQRAASDAGLPVRGEQTIKNIIGLGLPEAIATLYPEHPGDPRLETVRQRYGAHYLNLEQQPSPLYPGVEEALQRFREIGFKLAVATGKNRAGLDRVLRQRGWTGFFDITRAADETASKPDPLMLHEILHYCEVTPDRSLMIGDSPFDLEMARNARMDAVAVTYGAQSSAVLQQFKPRLSIDRFDQLHAWLTGGAQAVIKENTHVG